MTERGCDSCVSRRRDEGGAEHCAEFPGIRYALPANRICGSYRECVSDAPLWRMARDTGRQEPLL